jgi:hypothetical protein
MTLIGHGVRQGSSSAMRQPPTSPVPPIRIPQATANLVLRYATPFVPLVVRQALK